MITRLVGLQASGEVFVVCGLGKLWVLGGWSDVLYERESLRRKFVGAVVLVTGGVEGELHSVC